MNSEPLYQALIPKGQLAIKFEIPKYVDEYMIHLSHDTSNVNNLNQKQIQFFIMTFKCCCISNACKYGVPKNLQDQYQIFSITFSASFIDFLNSILKRNISYLDRYCSKIQPMLQPQAIDTESPDSKTFEDALRSFAQIKSYNVITTEHIEKRAKEIETYVKLPSLSPIINEIDESISQIINLIKEILYKPDHNASTKINTAISMIKQKSEEMNKYYDEFNEKLRSLFDPYSIKTYGNIITFMDEFISALNDFIFMAIKIAFFSDFEQTENNSFYSCLYKIANNSINILTDVHKLAHYRTNYTLSVVSIKLNFSFIFKNLSNIHKEIHNFLKFTPTLFQATMILEFTKITQKLFDADNEFLNQMNDFFTKIKSAKKSIVFKPINERQLTEKDESTQFFAEFQKCAYTIAFSLIKNNYQAYQLSGMTVLLQNSYTKLINHLSSQIVNKNLSAEEKIAYSLTFHSIQYAMSIFVNEFSEFGEKPDDKFLRSKSSIVALNLVFEIYTCKSNVDMTDIMENSLKMFLIFVGENNSMISSFYLIYRRAVQLSIFHSASLFSNFTNLLLKQLIYGADAPMTNIEVAKKLNKMLQHKLDSYRQYAIFDRTFTFPNSLYEIIIELKSYVDSLVFCSENYKFILLESIKCFKSFYSLVNSSISRTNIGHWDYDINFFNDLIEKGIAEVQNYRNLISSSNEDKDSKELDSTDSTKYVKNHSKISNSAFILSKSLFEICCLARQINDVPILTIEELRSDIVDLLDKSIELAIMAVDENSEQAVSEHYSSISKSLSQIENKLSKEILPITTKIAGSETKENDKKEAKFSPRDIFLFTDYDTLWKSKKSSHNSTPITLNYIKKLKAFYQNLDKSLETFQKSFNHRSRKSKSSKPSLLNEEQESENNGFILTSTVDPSASSASNSPTSSNPSLSQSSLNPRNVPLGPPQQRPSSIKIKMDPSTYLKSDHKSIPIQFLDGKSIFESSPKSRVPFASPSSASSSELKKNKQKGRSLTAKPKQSNSANLDQSRKIESGFDESVELSRVRSIDKRISLSKIMPISDMINGPSLPEFNKWKIRNSASKINVVNFDNQDNQNDNQNDENQNSIFPTLKVFDSDTVLTEALASRNTTNGNNSFGFENDDDSDSD